MTRWMNGWLLILVSLAVLGSVISCAKRQNAIVDPAAFGWPVG